jgi:hypothetical protein
MLTDTLREPLAVQTALLQHAAPAKRLRLMRALSNSTLSLSRRTIQRFFPTDWIGRTIALTYNVALAKKLTEEITKTESEAIRQRSEMNSPDIFAAIIPVIETLEQLHIAYHIGGSFASSAHGVPRATADVNLVTDLHLSQISEFAEKLQADYYVDEISIRRAIERRSSFNLIHLATMLKVDVFISKGRDFDREAARRAVAYALDDADDTKKVYLASPEDTILAKLEWYRKGGEVSERQLSDILDILRVQAEAIDHDYLRRWALELNVRDLLERLLDDADPITNSGIDDQLS